MGLQKVKLNSKTPQNEVFLGHKQIEKSLNDQNFQKEALVKPPKEFLPKVLWEQP